MDLGISGKWALVCAASKGLGKGCAAALVREGVNVVVTARGAELLQTTAAELRALNAAVQVRAVAGDITSAAGRTDAWEPFHPPDSASPPPLNLGPVGDWLDAIANDREPECSGRNGAWAVEMVMAVYQAALRRERVAFPLQERTHPLTAAAR